MSDSHTNVEIEDVLSSIRRLVSEDRAGARPEPQAGSVPPAPMAEGVVQTESATITHLQPRGAAANERPAPAGAGGSAETRIDAAIVALNAETAQEPELAAGGDAGEPAAAVAEPCVAAEAAEAWVAAEAAEAGAEGELVDTSDLLPEPYQQAGARGAQFVLTADFLVTPATPALPAEMPFPPDRAGEEPSGDMDAHPEATFAAEAATSPAAHPDHALDELVSGDALLATFGSVGPAGHRGGAWDSDALADLAPRSAPRAYPLHPTLEATIADLEMAVAAQSEEFEPDMGEDMGEDLGDDLGEDMGDDLSLAAPPAFDEAPAEASASEDPLLAWEAAEAAVGAGAAEAPLRQTSAPEAGVPLRRHRFHLNARPEPATPLGYIGVGDAFSAEDRDIGADLIEPRQAEALDMPAAADAAWASAVAYGDEFADLAIDGPALDLDAAGDEALLGLGDAIDAPRIDLDDAAEDTDSDDLDARAGEAEGYPDPAVDVAPEAAGDLTDSDGGFEATGDADAEGGAGFAAAPARRIFIAPRADLADAADLPGAGSDFDPEDGFGDLEPDDGGRDDEAAAGMARVATAAARSAVAGALSGDLAERVAGHLAATAQGDPDADNDAALPDSADMWQVRPSDRDDDEAIAVAPPMSIEDLRGLVLDLIRQELQGPLGERITRNVRKLVRREINRALENRDLE